MWKLAQRQNDPVGGSVRDQTLFGAGVGMACGGTFALVLAGTGPMVAFGATLGIASGFVVGLLVWMSSAVLPEESIPPLRSRPRGGSSRA